jgi:hypothetical protein
LKEIIEDVLSLTSYMLGDFVDRIYPIELEIRDTTDTDRSASYFDLLGKGNKMNADTYNNRK